MWMTLRSHSSASEKVVSAPRLITDALPWLLKDHPELMQKLRAGYAAAKAAGDAQAVKEMEADFPWLLK